MLEIVILCAFSIYGVRAIVYKLYNTFTYKELNWLGAEIRKQNKWKYYALMPIVFCRTCMSSVWGSLFYFFWGSSLKGVLVQSLIIEWPVSVISIAGVVYFMTRLEKGAY